MRCENLSYEPVIINNSQISTVKLRISSWFKKNWCLIYRLGIEMVETDWAPGRKNISDLYVKILLWE